VRLGGLQIYKNCDQIVSTVMMSVTVVVREISRNVFPIKCVLQCVTQCSLNWGVGIELGLF
jgi:hypothetical protein